MFGPTIRPNRGRLSLARLAAVGVALLAAGIAPQAHKATTVGVVVRARGGSAAAAARDVASVGGTLTRPLSLIDGFAARVPRDAVADLRSRPSIQAVTPDARVLLSHTIDGFDAATDAGSLYNTTKSTKAQDLWRSGWTGRGVDVALIDSGVVPVNGLTAAGKIVNGPDLSFESQATNLRYLDTFGHGTHMAGIIAGRDDDATPSTLTAHDTFAGVAPDARIVSIKVADATGATDVSQVIAAIDWVVQHRTDDGFNIRVLNLSFGTDANTDHRFDPLAFAAEVAWRKGIVVVVAAGNDPARGRLNDPAFDPYVLAVGADDTKGTYDATDDTIPSWSSRGDGTRNPDIVAPGKSIASLRAPGSNIDVGSPSARVGQRFFRGSGTSQAAAVVSGAAALLLQQRPSLTPDEVKRLLTSTATPLAGVPSTSQGSGIINLKAAGSAIPSGSAQTWPSAVGTGSLEGARGSAHVTADGVELRGEQDIFGHAWDGTTWSAHALDGTTWSGGNWMGTTWSGGCWCGTSWSGTTWSGTTWSGTTWSGTTWSGTTWSGTTWSGTTWSGTTWSGTTWSGTTWSGTTWSNRNWSSAGWE